MSYSLSPEASQRRGASDLRSDHITSAAELHRSRRHVSSSSPLPAVRVMPTGRYSASAPTSPHKPSDSMLSFLPSSTVPSYLLTKEYTYSSLTNVDDELHSSDSSPRHRPMLPRRLSQLVHSKPCCGFCAPSCTGLGCLTRWRWLWCWIVLCISLATILITGVSFSYVWYRGIYPSGQLCPIDMTAVNTQYSQLAQHHLLTVRGYSLLPPHSITASTISATHQQYEREDVTRYRWDTRRQWTWYQWLTNSPAAVMLVTKDGRELYSAPSTARSYVRVTQRMLQELVDNWQPREQLPQYMDLLINTDYSDQLRDRNNSASSNTPPTTAPIFSSCSTPTAADVPFLYSESWKNGGVYKLVESQLLFAMADKPESIVTLQPTGVQCVDVTAFTAQHWSAKRPTAIWRGSTTGGLYTPTSYHTFPRYQLALLSRLNQSGLIDAKLTHCTQCEPKEQMEQLLRTQLGDHFSRDLINAEQLTHYRALLDVDGNSWSSRLPQLMASGAVVLKQHSPYLEFFHELLRPDVHYVEVARNLSDVESAVEAVVKGSERGGEVAVNALRFARQYLTEDAVRLFAQHMLSLYAALLEVPTIS